MFPSFSLHRHVCSTREAREICQSPPRPPEKGYLEKGGEYLGGMAGWIAKNNLFTMGYNLGEGTVKGLYDSFVSSKSSEQLKEQQMRVMTEAMRVLPPAVKTLINNRYKNGPVPTFYQAVEMFNLQNWIVFFEKASFLDDAKPSELGGLLVGVKEDDKKKIFYEFVTNIIPLNIQNQISDKSIFGEPSDDPETRKETMIRKKAEIMQAIKYMMGIESPAVPQTDISFTIAQGTLKHHYQKKNDTMNDAFYEEMIQVSGQHPNLSTVESMRLDMGPSLLKGILDPKMNLFGAIQRGEVQHILSQKEMERNLRKLQVSQDVRKLSNVVKNQNERDRKTIGETFSNMGGLEKLALIGLVAYMLTKKTGQVIAGTAALMYFGQKFLLEQDDPINEIWSPIARGLTQKVTDVVQNPFERLTGIKFADKKLTPEEVDQRSEVVDNFMSKELRNKNKDTIVVMTLLSSMTLGDLARNSKLLPDGRVSILYTKDFKDKAAPMLAKMGLDERAIHKFFTNSPTILPEQQVKHLGLSGPVTQNMLAAGEGVAGLCYSVAVDMDATGKYALQAHAIEKYRRETGVGYLSLPKSIETDVNGDGNMEILDAQAAYIEMVTKGQIALQNSTDGALSNTKAIDYMAKKLGVSDPISQRDVISNQEKTFAKIAKEVQEVTKYHDEAASFTVKRDPTTDLVTVNIVGVSTPEQYTFQEFIAKGKADALVEDFVTKVYERKVGELAKGKKNEFTIFGGVRKVKILERKGGEIFFQFEDDSALKAKIKMIEFLKIPIGKDDPGFLDTKLLAMYEQYIVTADADKPDFNLNVMAY